MSALALRCGGADAFVRPGGLAMRPIDRSTCRRWIWANGWAEALGLGCTMLLGRLARPQPGALLGAAQACVLRRHVAHASRWTGANALAWAMGMAVLFAGFGVQPHDAGVGRMALGLIIVCLAAGPAAGAIHGLVPVALLREGPAVPMGGRP